MDTKFLNKLEFNKIIKNLSNFAVTKIGKEYCLNLTPIFNKKIVQELLKETTEAIIIKQRKSTPPIIDIPDITPHIKILNSSGTLNSKYLLELAHILKVSRELKQYFNNDDIDTSQFEILPEYFNNLYSNKNIEDKIFSAIIDENHIDDRASSKLYSIRNKQRSTENTIRESLASFLNKKYVQEPIITIRNNRFVIPIKQEFRGTVKGFVHDISSSGSTIFIEPLNIFELNNTLNSLKIEENIEIENILKELSSLFFNITDLLSNNLYNIGKIDFAFAKAKYAIEINATEPILNDNKYINLKNARHPLIEQSKVVPININIGDSFSTLVITGPNTGGKTVTLKTVGIIVLMAICGLYIPASENSSIYVFDNIYADIGDDQSISESLSTFSAHMTNIIQIVNNANSNSLVLLDELGSGTDPIEGSSLAVSILEYLHSLNILTIATTHYPEVKNYALINSGFENASCEFDLNTLSPTYNLLIGVPGKSMAFAISKKLGLKQEILDNASSKLNSDNINIEELLKNIYDNKISIQKEKQKIDNTLLEIENLKKSIENQKEEIEKSKSEIINKSKLEARKILLDAKDSANDLIKKLQDSKSASNVRNELNDKIKKLSMNNENIPSKTSSKLKKEDIHIGLKVHVDTLNQEATILSFPNNSNMLSIQIGNMKMNINISDLSYSNSKEDKETKISKTYASSNKSKYFSPELNVIGLNVDEALFIIDKYIDDALLAKVNTIRIVHGKGTGKLRNGIHNYLKNNKRVKSFRLGLYGEGENGVTIVEL